MIFLLIEAALGLVYIKKKMFYMNPILALFNYSIFECTGKDDATQINYEGEYYFITKGITINTDNIKSLEEELTKNIKEVGPILNINLDKETVVKVNTSNISNEDKEVQSKIDEMRSEDSKIRAAIAKAEREANRTSSRGNGGSRSPSSNPGGFIYPVPAAYKKVTSGMYYSESKRYHGAYDFGSGGIAGQPVYAVKDGTVIYTANLTNSYGTHVIIRHSSGLYTLYAHGQAGSLSVSVGQKVSQGQQIMRVGSTGNSSGPHLHFEVRVAPGGYNNRVNPMNYLP